MSTPPEFFIIGVFTGLTAAALFGLSNIVYKSQSSEIQPIAINAIKMWVALPVIVVLVLIFLFFSGFNVPLIAIPYLAGSIILGAVIGDLIYLTSQAKIGVSRAFPIAMCFPLLTYVFSIMLAIEPFRFSRFFGILVAILGIIFLTRKKPNQQEAEHQNTTPVKTNELKLGIMLALLATVFWAFSPIILQIGLVISDPIDANLIRIIVGSLTLLPVFLVARKRGMPMPTKRATKLTLIAGFFGMGIGSILFVLTVQFTGPAVTSVLAASAPLFALPLSIVVLKERVTQYVILGTMLAVIGIWLVLMGF